MRTLIKLIALVMAALTILTFLYGSIKLAESKKASNETISLAPGIHMVKNHSLKQMSSTAFRISFVFAAVSIIFFIAANKQKN